MTNWEWIKQLGVSDASTDITYLIAEVLPNPIQIDVKALRPLVEAKLREACK